MIITLTIDTTTLQTVCDDTSVSINFTKSQDGLIVCEISKPDSEEIQMMAGTGVVWQQ
jgi:hypothetical protein